MSGATFLPGCSASAAEGAARSNTAKKTFPFCLFQWRVKLSNFKCRNRGITRIVFAPGGESNLGHVEHFSLCFFGPIRNTFQLLF